MSTEYLSEDNKQEDLVNRLVSLENEIKEIKARNNRVEKDKAWEVSKFRVLVLLALTYLITTIVFCFISVPNAPLNALIPTIGYYLSTQSLPLIKNWWLKQHDI